MFDFIKQLLSAPTGSDYQYNVQKKLQIASCALFLEIANADNKFTEDERRKIIEIMKRLFDINTEYVNELIELAEKKIRESVSIYEFTDLINHNFSKEEKFKIMINLWRIIYIDKTLDQYEDHMIKIIGNNLKFEHREIIEAKLIAKEEITDK